MEIRQNRADVVAPPDKIHRKTFGQALHLFEVPCVGKHRPAADNKASARQARDDQRSGVQEIGLPLHWRDPADQADSPREPAPKFARDEWNLWNAVVNDVLFCGVRLPLSSHVAAVGDHGGSGAPDGPTGHASRKSIGQKMLRVKKQRPPACTQRRRRQRPRAARVDQIRILPCNPLSQPDCVVQEPCSISGSLFPAGVWSERDGRGLGSRAARRVEQRPGTWRRDESFPSTIANRGQQVEQTSLAAAQFAELLKEQDLHRRTAIASTQRYAGSTRQNVSKSLENIWNICPIQKQTIQVP